MEVSSVVGRAFAGTAKADPERSFHWVLGPQLLTIAVCGRELDMCAITAGPLVTVVAGAEVTRPRDNS